MKRTLFIIALILMLVSGFVYAATYTGADPEDLDKTTPTEGASPPSEINDSIREIKTVYLNQMAIKNATGTTTLTSTDSVLLCNGTFTTTLPTVNSVSSANVLKEYTIINIGTGTCTIDGNGSETIDGALTRALTEQYDSVKLIANTSGWYSSGGSGYSAALANTSATANRKVLLFNSSGIDPSYITPIDGAGSGIDADLLDGINSTALVANVVNDQGGGSDLKVKVIDIGDWNMDTTAQVDVAHGLTHTKIRSISVMIRTDTDNYVYTLPSWPAGPGTIDGWIHNTDATNVQLRRTGGGSYDSTSFDSTSYNRGWITIWYTE